MTRDGSSSVVNFLEVFEGIMFLWSIFGIDSANTTAPLYYINPANGTRNEKFKSFISSLATAWLIA